MLASFAAVFLFQLFHAPWYAWIALMFIGCQTPASAMFFIVVTQVVLVGAVPYLTGTQSFVLIWGLRNLLSIVQGAVLPPLRTVGVFLFPLAAWSLIAGAVNDDQLQTVCVMNSVGTAVIAITEFRRVAEQHQRAFVVAIALACVLAIFPYWFSKLGIQFGGAVGRVTLEGTQQVVEEHRVTRGEITRYAAAGIDFNYAGVCMNTAIAAFLSLFLLNVGGNGRSRAARLYRWLCIPPIILGVPAALATGSRGAAIGLLVSLTVPVFVQFIGFYGRKAIVHLVSIAGAICGLTLVVALTWWAVGTEVNEYVTGLLDYQEREGHLHGRMWVFEKAFDILTGTKGSPLFGESEDKFRSTHNMFLETVVYSGIPGFVMFSWIVLYPIGYFAMRRKFPPNLLNISVLYLITIFSGMHLAVGNFKLLWVLWGILVDCCRLKDRQSAERFAMLSPPRLGSSWSPPR